MSAPSRIGAFFDVDGTILPAPSLEWRFVRWLVARELLGAWQIGRWAASTIPSALTGSARALRTNKSYLAGLPLALAQAWDCAIPSSSLAPSPSAAQKIAWHTARGHHIVLVSGTLAPLASLFARRINTGIDVCATRLQSDHGTWTGAIAGEHMSGPQKARALARIAAREEISLAASFAYGNHADDVPMLETVGNPVAVNPRLRLKQIAAARRWQVESWATQTRGIQTRPAHAVVAPKEIH
jgi:HAD superfamily hydrolase (TIGR01490 family)